MSAPQHSTYTSPFTVQPGINADDVFIHENTVTYTWTVVPTTIPDNYTIQLQADFVTQVPIPNLVPGTPFVMPLVGEGGSIVFTENMTNEGLIEATNVQISAVSNGTFTLTPLVTSIPVLPAQSEYAIPVELTANPGVTVEDYASTRLLQFARAEHRVLVRGGQSGGANPPGEGLSCLRDRRSLYGHPERLGRILRASAPWPRTCSTRPTRPSSSRCWPTPPIRRQIPRGTPSAAICHVEGQLLRPWRTA